LVIAEGADLGGRSTLRKLFEAAAAGAAVPCYVEDAGQIRAFAEDLLRGLGHRVEPAASDWIARVMGGDRALLRGELEKLSLFAGPGAAITLVEAETCLGDSAQVDLETAALAAVSGDRAALDRILGRCFVAGQSPVAVLRALGRTVERLHLAAGMVAQGRSPDAALKALKPPVFWKHLPQYQRALGTWTVGRLGTALALLADAEADCKRAGAPDQAVAWRAALRIVQAAGRTPGLTR
ncbi:MAG: DNA polymerase III subunit delta, partial [Proteobacteria bacterium]|nr:DNA polymerase III subunit delta [Pseudomonadota bacterium]